MPAQCSVALLGIAVEPDVLAEEMLECLQKPGRSNAVPSAWRETLFPAHRLRSWQEPSLCCHRLSLGPWSNKLDRLQRGYASGPPKLS